MRTLLRQSGWTGRTSIPTMSLLIYPDKNVSQPSVTYLLLIDDDPAVIPEQVRQAFPGPRYRVEVAGTGAEGLRLVRAEPPDVILLDLRLPDQSGLEVYDQLRQIDARIPVVFVTLAKSADAAIEAMKH